MAKKSVSLLGAWAFLIGVLLAIIVGVLSVYVDSVSLANPGVMITLVVIGLIVGLLNVSGSEKSAFLLAGISLIIASTFGMGVVVAIPMFSSILLALLGIFVPAVIIVAIKEVFSIAKN